MLHQKYTTTVFHTNQSIHTSNNLYSTENHHPMDISTISYDPDATDISTLGNDSFDDDDDDDDDERLVMGTTAMTFAAVVSAGAIASISLASMTWNILSSNDSYSSNSSDDDEEEEEDSRVVSSRGTKKAKTSSRSYRILRLCHSI